MLSLNRKIVLWKHLGAKKIMDDKLHFVDIKTFKELAAAKETENVAVRKFMTLSKIDELTRDDEKLQLKFSITTADVDRDNDTIVVEGWDFTDYKKNPVVLWAHNYSTPPVAKAVNIFRDNLSIDSTAEFTPKEMYEFGYMIYQMYKGGYLNAVSVGFQPTDFELARDRDGGINFTRQSLMEYSAVPVPSNPNALLQARSKGIDTAPMKEWAENILDDWEMSGEGLLIPKKLIESVRTESDPKQKTSVSVPDSTETTSEPQNSDKGADGKESKPDQESETPESRGTEDESADETGDKSQTDQEIKRAISYSQAHPNGTPQAAKDTDWNGTEQFTAASIENLAIMSAWVDEENPDTKAAYDLPHHLSSDQHSLVWRGVTTAMGALLGARGVNVPADERKAVYDHLAKHYAEFNETPPEFRYVDIQILKNLNDDYFFDYENGQIEKWTDEIKISKEINDFSLRLKQLYDYANCDHVKGAMLEAINAFKDFKESDCDCPDHSEQPQKPIPQDPDAADVVLELSEETNEQDESVLPDELDAGTIAEIVEQAVDAKIRKMTGKLD